MAITVTIASITKRIVSIPSAFCIADAVFVCTVPQVPFNVVVEVVTLDRMVGSRYNSIDVTMKARTPPSAIPIIVDAACPLTDLLSLSKNLIFMLLYLYNPIYILGYPLLCKYRLNPSHNLSQTTHT